MGNGGGFGGNNNNAALAAAILAAQIANQNNGHNYNNFNRQNFNAFGTKTVVDNRGNVFEVDAFGNSRRVSGNFNNGRNRGFGGNNHCN